MARTKASRGVAPFQMRSGNSPMSLFGLADRGLQLINKLRKKKNDLSGDTGGDETLGGKLDAINTKLDSLSSGGGNTIGNASGQGGLIGSLAGDAVTKAKEATASLTGDNSEEEEILNKEV